MNVGGHNKIKMAER
ncbi:hypothetical protein EI981_15095 [Paenibacillus lutimineralis]|uniref:Uncharacterized protein n=1 Tax=Paenibacillus lutimineralis TaxID=2707005 RepID=A0A3Q9IHR0_9BACL|nr:hypothetical protein EI981_15095 [Paenibacillus lutimineralis]